MADFDIRRDVGVQLLLDTSRINSRQRDAEVNQLERWCEDGVITLVMSESSQDEARADGDHLRIRKALGHVATVTHAHTENEGKLLRQIEAILFPNGPTTKNQKNDVDIVFSAAKYSGILVTNDGESKRQPGGILGNADALQNLGVRVMRAGEAVRLVRTKILIRDRNARQYAERYGKPMFEWVGKD